MNRIILNELFDCYESLLTDKERQCFRDYYSEDLSLSEIAFNNEVSRNAIHKTIKTVENKLEKFEKALLIYKNKTILKEALELNDIIKIKEVIRNLID